MAITVLQNSILKGIRNDFLESMADIPQLWQAYSQEVKSDTDSETYVFGGPVPFPRVFTDSRSFQEFTDFKFAVVNNEYELSFIIGMTYFEDDQIGIVQERFADIKSAWGSFKNQLAADLLGNGGSTTLGIPPINSADGISWASFFNSTGSWGSSGSQSNTYAVSIVDKADPTTAEIHAALKEAMETMDKFTDDQNRLGYNFMASKTKRLIVPVEHGVRFAEALNASFIMGSDAQGGSRENVAF